MRKLIFLFTLFWIGNVLYAPAQNITFKASAEKAVVVNQQFRVAYTLTTGGETGKEVRVSESKDLELLYGPTPSEHFISSSNINGKVSSQLTDVYTCFFLAKKEGSFTIPQATIRVGNSEYKSNELTITVLPPDQSAAAAAPSSRQDQAQQPGSSSGSTDETFIRMHVSKNSVYENEGFLVTFKLYSLVDISGFGSVKFPEFEGFSAQEIELPSTTQLNLESYNGRNYRTLILKQTILYPIQSGKITIGAGKFEVNARVRTQQRQRNIFDDFFDATTNVKKSLTSAPATIDVKPLPAGKPASFTGAVGEYKMTSSISTNHLKSNEAVTLKLTISGNGNVKLIKNPEVVFPNDFDILDPVVNTSSKANAGGVSGVKTVEYNAIPRFAGDFTIPKAEFSYFDLKSGTYKTLVSEEYQLNVDQDDSGNGNTTPIFNANNKQDVRFLGKDIHYIKTEDYRFHKDDFIYGTINYLLFYLVPALLFIVLFIVYRKQAAENANIALVRTKKANKVASKRLKTAAKYLKENKQEAFYDEILKAVWGYLSDKLNIPVSALTKDNVDVNLTQFGAAESLIGDFRNILDTAEFARFAPTQGSGGMSELYDSTVHAIDKMESTIKK